MYQVLGLTAHCRGQGRAYHVWSAIYIKRRRSHYYFLVSFIDLNLVQPNLPVRLQEDIPLTPPDQSKLYQVGNLTPSGYSDWPFADGNVRETDGKL
ncbi:hypothetical protein L210DRAFT_436596 [Boletus edulis BED1]|uniref:Uncharacterized protein n=1 Tax=Boletus edulis BED1 TaxID=1328754 RepID=A0AAD4BWN5_BOLED|nr:hypothetical protein L210DRAFT_436596 [Boletus edulis BED1]